MARVYILTTTHQNDAAFHGLVQNVSKDTQGQHSLVHEVESADLIIFVESGISNHYFDSMRRHPYVRDYRSKCFCICESDGVVPLFPGVYTSIEKQWYRSNRTRCGSYLAMYQNDWVRHAPLSGNEPFLFSFIGDSNTSPIRKALLMQNHPRAYLMNSASHGWEIRHGDDQNKKRDFEKEYADLIKDSLFTLCPRGVSPSSVRLFDVMKTGRVPVIISDQWVPPEGPTWSDFSIRVPESEAHQTSGVIEAYEHKAKEMGLKARLAYEQWFAPEVIFHRIVEWCMSIDRERTRPELSLPWVVLRQLVSAKHRRHYVRSRGRLLKGKLC